jgi:hypothetical protein
MIRLSHKLFIATLSTFLIFAHCGKPHHPTRTKAHGTVSAFLYETPDVQERA